MSDFFSDSWSIWITSVTVLGIIFCLWLLWSQRSWLGSTTVVEDTGHEWDGVVELNNPVPRWWTVMYLGLCVIGVAIMVLYPALGSYEGVLGYTAAKQVKQQQNEYNEQIKPVYAKFANESIESLASNPEARAIGERLFLNNCAQCHGSDARGGMNFPNLTNNDWLWGGKPEDIIKTITEGRHGIMAPLGSVIKPDEAEAIANYVRSLSGLSADPILLARGEKSFKTICAVCHGEDGKGNQLLGSANLTDDIWLGGSSKETIVKTILNGRENVMPAQGNHLTPEQIRMLGAYVWGLSNVKQE